MPKGEGYSYPSMPPRGNSESKRGYPKENFGTARYSRKPFPANADHSGVADGVLGKGSRKPKTPPLPESEQLRPFPKNRDRY